MGSAFKLSVSGSGGPTIMMRPVGVRGSSGANSTAETQSPSGDVGATQPVTRPFSQPTGQPRPAARANGVPNQLQVGLVTKILESMIKLVEIIASKIPS